MTNDQRKELGKLHWMPAVRLWDMGFSAEMISKVMGYKNVKSFITKKNQLRKKYPDWFTARQPGFTTVKTTYSFC